MYKYTHFIPENIAPVGVQKIGVYNGKKRVCDVSLGRLTPPQGTPLYSFCVLADTHLDADRQDEKVTLFERALEYVNGDHNCKFTVVCGDLVDNGLLDIQAENYKAVVGETAKKPVYSISGNHDTIWGYPTDARMESYTGYPLYYAVAKTGEISGRIYANADISESDLLIFLGYYGKDHSGGNGDWRGGEQFSAEELTWLESTLSDNVDKRCFIFIHPYIPGGAGNPPLTVTPPNPPPDLWTKKSNVTTDAGADFLTILARYPETLLFNGHSHYRYRTQEEESKAVVYVADGYTSIHVPSVTRLRDVENGKRKDLTVSDSDYGGEGYIVDVYSDYICLRGRDFWKGDWSVIGTYKIDAKI